MFNDTIYVPFPHVNRIGVPVRNDLQCQLTGEQTHRHLIKSVGRIRTRGESTVREEREKEREGGGRSRECCERRERKRERERETGRRKI